MRQFFTKQFYALKKTDKHWLRHTIGFLLVAGGLLGFLPVLGYWMLPLGLALLAVDFPLARKLYRRLNVWWGWLTYKLRAKTKPSTRARNAMPNQKGEDSGTRNGSPPPQ